MDKYDDPNTAVNKLMLALTGMGFELSFPANRLKQVPFSVVSVFRRHLCVLLSTIAISAAIDDVVPRTDRGMYGISSTETVEYFRRLHERYQDAQRGLKLKNSRVGRESRIWPSRLHYKHNNTCYA